MKIIRTLTCDEAAEMTANGDKVYVILFSGWSEFEYLELDNEQLCQIMDLLAYYENDDGIALASSLFDVPDESRIDIPKGNVIFTFKDARRTDDFWKLVGLLGDGIRK